MALLMQRARYGPQALTAREALAMGTIGGAACLGREAEIGSLEPGKLADVAVWRMDGFHAAVDDPVVAFAHGGRTPPLARLLVGGRTVVADDRLVTTGEDALALAGAAAHRRALR